MLFIRSLLYNIFFFSWTAVMMILYLPVLLLPKKFLMKYGANVWSAGIIFGARIFAGIKLEVKGKEHIQKYLDENEGFVIASQHQSAFETLVFYAIVNAPVYVLKRELMFIPLLGIYVFKMGCVAVNRSGQSAALRSLIKQVKQYVADGRQVIVFPEGTRVLPGKNVDYQPGIAAIYKQTGADIIPMKLDSGRCWPRHGFLKKPGLITFEFLKPMEKGLKRDGFMKTLRDSLES